MLMSQIFKFLKRAIPTRERLPLKSQREVLNAWKSYIDELRGGGTNVVYPVIEPFGPFADYRDAVTLHDMVTKEYVEYAEALKKVIEHGKKTATAV
jgi:hypothetical protein